MVSVYTKGRYGNSTWQQMVAWVYAKKHGLEYSAPKESLAPNVWLTYHKHLQREDWDYARKHIEINDGKHSYAELPFDEDWRDLNIIIGTKSIETGYFQSYLYLSGYEDQIRHAFDMHGHTKYGRVGLHWRLGDYRQFITKHPIATDVYMLNAIAKVWDMAGTVKEFIFYSDEINHCREFVKKYYYNYPDGLFCFSELDVESDFMDMMHCEHQVVCNSSYSVLAGILNPNRRKIIVCPDESCYFGPDNSLLDTSTIMPSDWVRIKY